MPTLQSPRKPDQRDGTARALTAVILWALGSLWAADATSAQIAEQPASEPPAAEAAAPDAGSRALTAQDLVRPPFLADPVLSPDGTRIAARYWREGRELLGVYQLVAGKAGAMTGFPLGPGQNLVSYLWASDRHLLVSIRMHWTAGRARLWGHRLFLYTPDAGELKPLLADNVKLRGDNIIHVAPDGSHILLVCCRGPQPPTVYRVEIPSGTHSRVIRGQRGIVEWVADGSGNVRLGMGPHRSGLKVVYRDAGETRFRELGRVRLDRVGGDVGWVNFAGDGTAYIISNAVTGRYGLYRLDLERSAIGAPVFEHPRVDIGMPILGPDRQIFGVTYEDERPGIYWLDPGMQAIQDEVDNALPGRSNLFVSSNRDASRFIVLTASGADPGQYYLYQVDPGVLSRIASPREWLRGKDLADVTPVSYRARDGLAIPAYLTLPHDPPAGRLPAVILPPTTPGQRVSWSFDPWVQFLASRGYAVLQPNVRGVPGYGLEFRQKGVGEEASGMQTDLVDGVRWLVERGLVDPERVCIVGATYGGHSALLGVLEFPDVYRCAASFSPIGELAPGRLAAGLKRPLMVVQGEEDSFAVRLTLQEQGLAGPDQPGSVEFHMVEGLGYAPAVPATLERAMLMVEAFLTRHNPPGGTPVGAGTER